MEIIQSNHIEMVRTLYEACGHKVLSAEEHQQDDGSSHTIIEVKLNKEEKCQKQ